MKQSKVIFLTTCMLLLAHISFSQVNVDSLLQSQPQSTTDIIGKLRTTLIDAFMQNDKQKVRELHRYLSENFSQEGYVTLFPSEKILLFAWSGDFKDMLQYVKGIDSTYLAQMQKKIMPSDNNFNQIVKERVQQESEVIFHNLRSSSLTQEEKDFTAIYVHYYLITHENIDTVVSTINTNTRAFITAYPTSEYIKLLDSYELQPSDWGWGVGVNFGYSAKTGNLATSITNSGAIDISMDVTYKKYMATMGFFGVFGNVRQDIGISPEIVLPKDVTGNITNLYLSFGYRFFDDKRLIVMPVAGIGATWINPGAKEDRSNNPILEQFDYSYGLTTNFGIMTDIRFGKMKRIPGQNFAYPSFCAIRLSYRFSFNTMKQVPTYYNGNLHTITVGFSIYSRSIKYVEYQ